MCASILKTLDIPEFPVRGSLCGQGHWERIKLYDVSHHYQEVTILIEDAGRFKSFAHWLKIAKNCIENEISLRPVGGGLFSRERKFYLIAKKTMALEELVKKIQMFESVKFITGNPNDVREYPVLHHYSLYDRSTGLVFEGIGNDCITLRGKGIIITAVIPIYAALNILFNSAIIVPKIVYLTSRIFYDYVVREDRTVTMGAIAKERIKEMGWTVWESIRNIVRTPFYAIGFMLGTLYMIVDPLNGMKWAGCFEYQWNHTIPVTSSFCFCPQRDFFKDGPRTFLLARCLSPQAYLNENRQVVSLKGDKVKKNLRVSEPMLASLLSIPFCCNFSFPSTDHLQASSSVESM